MLFCLHCLDRPGKLETRMARIEAHRAYLASSDLPVEVVMSGPLVADDGETMIGSLFLVEAPGRAEAEAFNQRDPFHAADLWETVNIQAFWRRVG